MTKSYLTIAGDMWDMIAYKVYGTAHQMHRLMEANRNHADTVLFQAGVTLVIPEPLVTIADTLPPWKRGGQ